MENNVKSKLIASIGSEFHPDTYIAVNMEIVAGAVVLEAELCEYSRVQRRYVRGAVPGAKFTFREDDPDDMRGLVEDRAKDIRGVAEKLTSDIFGDGNPRLIRDRDIVDAALMKWDGEFDVPNDTGEAKAPGQGPVARSQPITAPVAAE